jgi:hypothetical protein
MRQFNLTTRLLWSIQIGSISKRFPPTKFCIRRHSCHQGCCLPTKCHRYDGGNLGTEISFIVILLSATMATQTIEGRTARFIVITTSSILSVTSVTVGVAGRIVYFTVTTPVIRAAVILLNAVVMIVMPMVLTAYRWLLMLSSEQMLFYFLCEKL